ncbi:dihydrodipicolinate synthase family protein [uncultured Victivallis sp.]|uniref:dihydrodipicolinate synthase family protein n=1 Tax=uncultured Victivallis sp. TaxID=354118 RepID=UPI002594C6A0|nr:dihydrodipicolinate synthase family protein [uncultured Victivallis sp.]
MTDSMNPFGVWPVMLTPFTETGALDRPGCEALVDWYLAGRVTGIFTVCLSSEMFDLTPAERLELAELTVRRVSSRVPVVACAGFGDTAEQRLRSIREMADTGVDAVVLPLSVLFPEETSGELVAETLLRLPERLPGITLGLYECPVPYKRSISPELLGKLARDCGNRYRFLKDTCCDRVQLHARCAAAAGSGLAVYNANLTTLTDSLRNGCAGFSGIAANFFPDALAELGCAVTGDPGKADRMQIVFNTLERNVEHRYPRGAKVFLRQQGLPVTDFCRTPRPGLSAEEVEQSRDFGRFLELWKQSGYDFHPNKEL